MTKKISEDCSVNKPKSNTFYYGASVFLLGSFLTGCAAFQTESAAAKRYRELGQFQEQDNEFYTEFSNQKITGIGFEKGVNRRDPSGVIKVGDLYYVWYTRSTGEPVEQTQASDTKPMTSYDLADIWYATSKDGLAWQEQGIAAKRGPKGSFDHRSIFTADILVAKGKYYLAYQAVGDLSQGLGWDFGYNVIGMSWADSPDGPWHRLPEPILELGPMGDFDSLNIHDPSFIVKGGKYYLYFKGQPAAEEIPHYLAPRDTKYGVRIAWGVAIADQPEGPYKKSKLNPILMGGHESIVFPYRDGICAFQTQGAEKDTIQFSTDGINFYPKAHGIMAPLFKKRVEFPSAGGIYRVGHFADIETQPGQGITWGLRNCAGGGWHHLGRFDCDLTLERGERLRKANEEWAKTRKR